jgi:hypothetical protein
MTGRHVLMRVLLATAAVAVIAAVAAARPSSSPPDPARPPAGTGLSVPGGSPVMDPSQAASIREYWTPERMRRAKPAP